MLNNIPNIYKKSTWIKSTGIFLAILSLMTGLILVASSSWFITATAITGLGLTSLQAYNLFLPSATIRFLALAKPLSRYYERFFTHRATLQTLSNSRVWLFENIISLKKQELVKFRMAEISSRLLADIDELDHLYLGLVIPWLSAGGAFLILGTFLLLVLPQVLWILLSVFLLALLFIPYLSYRSGKSMEETSMFIQRQSHIDLVAFLKNFVDLRVYGLIHKSEQTISRQVDIEQTIRKRSKIKLAFYTSIQQLALQAGLILIVVITFQNKSSLSGPIMVLIILSCMSLFETLQIMPAQAHQFARTAWAGSRINQWQPNADKLEKRNRIPLSPNSKEIVLSNVTCLYNSRKIFAKLNFTFPPNQITAITGSNGAGKTSLLDILAGLKMPDKGNIRIGNLSLANLDPDELVTQIGYMEQKAMLFNLSIYENIALAKAGATEVEIYQAAIHAGLGPHIEQQLNFLSTIAGESGKNISGGQARLISLARIILKDAPVLLLDEPTEGLDSLAEQRLISLLLSWKNKKTVIVVTHKKSIISIADCTLAM